MNYTNEEIGQQLNNELAKGYDIVRISRWAFNIFYNHTRELSATQRNVLEELFRMEDDPQFEYTEQELRSLADNLIAEGQKEELSKPILDIKDTAKELDETWLMCPLCQEAWEDHSEYGMVRCPKCNNILYNPRFKS